MPSERLRGKRVLIVDDDRDVLDLVESVLVQVGADVLKATSSDEAIVLVRSRPDVIVSDLEMPDGDGLHFMRCLRRRAPEDGAATPAIALTGHKRVEDKTRALLAGFQVHLGKPIRSDELVTSIEEVIRDARR
jgi:CheY-like chemotaxis protein